MNNKEKRLLLQIYRDCLKLKKKGGLTEFGRGQLVISKLLLGK